MNTGRPGNVDGMPNRPISGAAYSAIRPRGQLSADKLTERETYNDEKVEEYNIMEQVRVGVGMGVGRL